MGGDEVRTVDGDKASEQESTGDRPTLSVLRAAARRQPSNETPSIPTRAYCTGEARATLTVMSGSDAGRLVAIGSDPLIIGRDAASDLCLDDPGVSRHHARVVRQ